MMGSDLILVTEELTEHFGTGNRRKIGIVQAFMHRPDTCCCSTKEAGKARRARSHRHDAPLAWPPSGMVLPVARRFSG
jgi:hypothetical protein